MCMSRSYLWDINKMCIALPLILYKRLRVENGPTSCRRHSQDWSLSPLLNLTRNYYFLGYDVILDRRQASTWTNYNPAHWCAYDWPSLSVTNPCFYIVFHARNTPPECSGIYSTHSDCIWVLSCYDIVDFTWIFSLKCSVRPVSC